MSTAGTYPACCLFFLHCHFYIGKQFLSLSASYGCLKTGFNIFTNIIFPAEFVHRKQKIHISCDSGGGVIDDVSKSPQRSAIVAIVARSSGMSLRVTSLRRVSLKFGRPLK